MSDMPNL